MQQPASVSNETQPATRGRGYAKGTREMRTDQSDVVSIGGCKKAVKGAPSARWRYIVVLNRLRSSLDLLKTFQV
jgi:hypothetical protein